ncbi:hypothetical protein B5P43_18100 [Bacillus sp. SRB_336]|nr:hypothetical protein B5P43_18100 [Bacillus sp. SRB_336]
MRRRRCRCPEGFDTLDGMTIQESRKGNTAVNAIRAFGTVARRKDLLLRGCTAWDLKQALARGTIRSVSRGYFALPEADPLDLRLAQHQARRACFTKAEELGLWVIRPMAEPHVAVAHGRPVPGCVVHRVNGGLTLIDILRQCVRCGTQVEALAVLESAVVLKRCTIGQLRSAFSGRPLRRGGPSWR